MVGFKGLTYAACHCSWWRRLLNLHKAHTGQTIIASRYAPGSGISGEPVNYAALEAAYEEATWGDREPNIGIASLDGIARLRASYTHESIEEARQWLVDHSELIEDEDGHPIRKFTSDDVAAFMGMYP